jgi:hypothetical protein
MPNYTYVENYLMNVERQPDGWPMGIEEPEKEWLTRGVKAVLRRPGSTPVALRIMEIHSHLETLLSTGMLWGKTVDTVPPYPEGGKWKKAALWDYRLACVHRALLAADAEQVWRL